MPRWKIKVSMRNTRYLITKVEKKMHQELQTVTKGMLVTQIFHI